MLRSSCIHRDLVKSGINVGRAQLAQQFATMDGWQAGQEGRFDDYVRGKRKKEGFDSFDQRVERAYRVACKAHKTEVVNAFKRRLKDSNAKFTAQIMLDMKKKTEERLGWLREVWAQIDADYRSNDVSRQERAAQEISLTLKGDPGEYMRWIYEQKLEDRFAGEKGKAASEAALGPEQLDVTDEEINRYKNLKVNMTEIERNVKSKFGIAGQQHWAELQAAKDAVYEQKLDQAAKVYHELLDQSSRMEESQRTALLRSNVERIHQAQVRFKASLELEDEREKLVEAHEKMEKERRQLEKETRRMLLQEAAELKAKGATSDEVQQYMRQRQLDQHAQRQAEYQLKEREAVLQAKSQYLNMIDQLKDDFERRDGMELLRQEKKDDRGHVNAFGFMEEDTLDNGDTSPLPTTTTTSGSPSSTAKFVRDEKAQSLQGTRSPQYTPSPYEESKQKIWDAINKNKYEDPFLTVHQARLDAVKNYDSIFARTTSLDTKQGRKYARQNMGEHAVGGGTENQMYQKGNDEALARQWGINAQVVHDLDADGSKGYFMDNLWHVRDPETGDIDWRYERKLGGPIFRGPTLYRMGAQREMADPAEQPMDPSPEVLRLQRENRRNLNLEPTPSTGAPSPRESRRQEEGGRRNSKSIRNCRLLDKNCSSLVGPQKN